MKKPSLISVLIGCALLSFTNLTSAQEQRPFRFFFNASGLNPSASGVASVDLELKQLLGSVEFMSMELERDRNNRYEAEELIPRESEYFMISGYWEATDSDYRLYLPIQLVHNSTYPSPDIRELTKTERFVNANDAFFVSLHMRARDAFEAGNTPLALLFLEKLYVHELVELSNGNSAALSYFHTYEDSITRPENLPYTLTVWDNIYNSSKENIDLVMTYANFLANLGNKEIDGLPLFGSNLGNYRKNRLHSLAEQNLNGLFTNYVSIAYQLFDSRQFTDCVSMSSKLLEELTRADDYHATVKANDDWQTSLTRYLLIGSSCLHREFELSRGIVDGSMMLDDRFRNFIQQDPDTRKFAELYVSIVEAFSLDYLDGVSDTAKDVKKYYMAYTGT